MKKGLTLSLFSVVGCLFAFTLLELCLRTFGFEYPPADDPIAIWNKIEDRDLRLGQGLHRAAAKQLWEPRPGAELPRTWTGERECVNAAGYRGPERSPIKTPGVLRIATLGDSSTFGYGVPYADCYSAQLEARLNEAGQRAQVLDFGVIGFTLLQGIERYRACVRDYHPDVVVAAFGAVNDHHLAQGLTDAEKIARSVSSESAFGVLSRKAREDLRVFHLIARAVDSFRAQDIAKQDELERHMLELNATRPHMGELDFESTWHGVRRVSLEAFTAGLSVLKRTVEADGATLVIVSMPRRPGIDFDSPVLRKYSSILVGFCKSAACLLFDGHGDFRAYREVEHGDPTLFFLDGDDYHPSKRGHARLALGLCETIVKSRGPH